MPRRTDRSCRAGTPLPAKSAEGGLTSRGREHLRRLDRVFADLPGPVYYLTSCVHYREKVLANPAAAGVLVEAWRTSPEVYGWAVGRYVVMPDHVHFFATPWREDEKTLSAFIGSWKRWTKRHLIDAGLRDFEWQPEFFDHVLRSDESYSQKWEYVRQNPVRGRLVAVPEEWPYQGELVVF